MVDLRLNAERSLLSRLRKCSNPYYQNVSCDSLRSSQHAGGGG